MLLCGEIKIIAMKLNRTLKLREIGEEYMIIDTHSEEVDMTRVFCLNRMAAWIWNRIGEADVTEDLLVDWVCSEYDVDRETAEKDIRKLVSKWRECGILLGE